MPVEVTPMSGPQARATANAAINWLAGGSPATSARQRVTRGQVAVFLGLVVVTVGGLIVSPVGTAVVGATLFTLAYLATLAHRVVMFRASMRSDPFHRVSDEEARAVRDEDLPAYAVLVPAFGEPEVMAGLIRSLEELDYPRDRLQVKLLLEEGDDDTLAAALAVATPLRVEVLIVPAGSPQTKPRALNFGLLWSDSELVTIYDAEDRPEPLQLRRAAVALARLGPEWGCLQARLGFYEADRNLLSKWFCAEYLTWFTCFLPGAVELGGVVPLGGTSNHFRRDALVDVGAWDPFNVTEDADLGIRAAMHGYRVGIVNSTTYEEANKHVGNWLRQRSRWIKGYMQTALVFSRDPVGLVRRAGWKHTLGFALLIGGTPLIFLIQPISIILTLIWLFTRSSLLEALFPPVVLYLSLFNLLIGNALAIYVNMFAVFKRKLHMLVLFSLFNPFYWVLHSIASFKALGQLFTKPYYWEKTDHGLTRHGTAG
jgi:cellulose synthase/poly-beta-1,6-N-acetylglucosamine synthase-like glycosyltransferase